MISLKQVPNTFEMTPSLWYDWIFIETLLIKIADILGIRNLYIPHPVFYQGIGIWI